MSVRENSLWFALVFETAFSLIVIILLFIKRFQGLSLHIGSPLFLQAREIERLDINWRTILKKFLLSTSLLNRDKWVAYWKGVR